MKRDTDFLSMFNIGRSPNPMLPDMPSPQFPELLTEDEPIRYLRLDTINILNPSATLRRYRERKLLRETQISKRIFYRRVELDRFIERVTEGSQSTWTFTGRRSVGGVLLAAGINDLVSSSTSVG